MRIARALNLKLLWVASLAVSVAAHAEFYRWIDTRGQVRISNIPPQGVASDGSVIARYNPSAIAAQQAALRKRLQARDAQMQLARDAQSALVGAQSETLETEAARSK